MSQGFGRNGSEKRALKFEVLFVWLLIGFLVLVINEIEINS